MVRFRPVFLLLFLFVMLAGCRREAGPGKAGEPRGIGTGRADCAGDEEDFWKMKREEMVSRQIEARGVKDERVLAAMRSVPRHCFLTGHTRYRAYDDSPVTIGWNQTISQPYIVAFMTEQLQLEGGEKVLEIGTGSGYQAAVLVKAGASVFSIEIVPELAEFARSNLSGPEYDGVSLRCGDGYKGWPEEAPFDRVIVTAAPDHIPEPLIEQLAPGGLMIVPVGKFFQELVLVEKKKNGRIKKKNVLPVRFVPMTGEAEDSHN